LSAEQQRQASDNRWKERLQAWDDAQEALQDLQDCDTPQMRRTTLKLAKERGFWSVWYTVFKEDEQMRDWLIQEFSGTARDCFDAQDRPIPRPGGQL
jgi:hypothetical protein